ncbi:uncharacterized protein LOC118465845 [Anopheles albimanus]|uniref:uncharacterized protein LOC118465845 n=1 Tax=Anopheles albimanus TaxID=7167 RepID=UPI00164183C4|nr:uncharacterized protein LOC118465845 [Anopheles albimanus]
MNTMTSLSYETGVDSLPEEMLCMIFDRLDLWSVKEASLTCRRWHDIIYLSGYINRFKFQLDFPWASNAKAGKARYQEFLEELIGTVKHTQRCYRYMHFMVRAYSDDAFPLVWETLHPKMTENICSLKVDMIEAGKSTFAAVSESIALMPRLRSLTIVNWSEKYYFKTLRGFTVQHLEIDQQKEFAVDMPELKSFEGSLDVLQQACYNPQQLVLTKLKHAILTDYSENQLSVVDRLAALETLQVNTQLNENLLIAICDACTSLKELRIRRGVHITDRTTFRRLSNLVNVRILKFREISKHENLSFDVDLSKLRHLELLHLGSNVFWEPTSLIWLPDSIRNLSVPVTVETEGNLIQIITATLTQLQKLRLWYPEYSHTTVSKRSIRALPHLKRLEELSFVNAEFKKSDFLSMDVPMPQLRQLRFEACRLEWFLGLEEMLPNLRDIERRC